MSLAGEAECEGDECKPVREEETPGRVERRTGDHGVKNRDRTSKMRDNFHGRRRIKYLQSRMSAIERNILKKSHIKGMI